METGIRLAGQMLGRREYLNTEKINLEGTGNIYRKLVLIDVGLGKEHIDNKMRPGAWYREDEYITVTAETPASVHSPSRVAKVTRNH